VRTRQSVAALIVMAVMAFGSVACASQRDERIQMALSRRFQPSAIEIQDPIHRGMVVRQGQVLTLMAGGISAKPLRVTRPDRHGSIGHVMEFARVDVGTDGRIRAEAGELPVPKGTRIVVLDINVIGDRVHLLAHTADPLVAASRGGPAYGCAEFVYQIPRSVVQGGDPEPLLQLIEQSLEWSPEQRVCAPGDPQLCLEP